MATDHRRRILFVAEAVTLAHVARPFVLAKSLDPASYDVHFACDPRFNKLLGPLPFAHRPIRTIPGERFLDALARGRPVYDTQTLREYVEEDRKLLAETAPDLVVGDFRLSLSISARLAGVPYATITNAYWSPYARQRWPLPDLPMNRVLGVPLARIVFRLARPVAFALHCVPLNRVRRENGLPSLGADLRCIYTDADYTLYADVPELVPVFDAPPNHLYLGPVLWSPAVEPPAWWDTLPTDRPIVYVTLGSSGRSDLFGVVLQALAELPVTVIAATAGRTDVKDVPPNAFVADYLPGEEAAARSAVVVCNGGSPTTQQALAAGKPVIGIASNMDQYLNMGAIERAGAGVLLRASRLRVSDCSAAVRQILSTAKTTAASVQDVFARCPALSRFESFLNQELTVRSPAAKP
jgi:UDP:flavonoid glycosyltransferase YjiC (YdhE family)